MSNAPVLRHPVGIDAATLASQRAAVSDETWIQGLSTPDDAAWRALMVQWAATEVPPL